MFMLWLLLITVQNIFILAMSSPPLERVSKQNVSFMTFNQIFVVGVISDLNATTIQHKIISYYLIKKKHLMTVVVYEADKIFCWSIHCEMSLMTWLSPCYISTNSTYSTASKHLSDQWMRLFCHKCKLDALILLHSCYSSSVLSLYSSLCCT